MNIFLIGIICFTLGFMYWIDPIHKLDIKLTRFLYRALRIFPGISFFQEVWIFGKTPVAILVILYLIGTNFWLGVTALLVFVIRAGIERFLKVSLGRPRPFLALQDVEMTQPKTPTDPSFPSGDCVNVWFLIIVLHGTLNTTWPVEILFYLVALSVSLGRMGLGVHYFSDVLSGAGLGLLAGKATTLIWQTIPFPVFGIP
ncbi:MAG: phosphatase PAP2 family protein [Anaerolineales bacterium]